MIMPSFLVVPSVDDDADDEVDDNEGDEEDREADVCQHLDLFVHHGVPDLHLLVVDVAVAVGEGQAWFCRRFVAVLLAAGECSQ